MDRKTWSVAWRHARRITGKQRRFGEEHHLKVAQRELGGRRLPLADQCRALECWQARLYGPAVASFAQARTKRFYALVDKCRDRWEREALAESKLLADSTAKVIEDHISSLPARAASLVRRSMDGRL